MKHACEKTGLSYETLKFYCKEGLVPDVKRDKNNYRIFDEKNIAWLKGLHCLRKCGMNIKDMKLYMNYCLEGPSTIPQRKEMLDKTKIALLSKMNEINECINFIDNSIKITHLHISFKLNSLLATNLSIYSICQRIHPNIFFFNINKLR